MSLNNQKPKNNVKKLELQIDGHPVTCVFAREPDPVAKKLVRNCLLDSYIQKYGINEDKKA